MSKKLILTESQYRELVRSILNESWQGEQANHEEGFKLAQLIGKTVCYYNDGGKGCFKVDDIQACKDGWLLRASRSDGRYLVIDNNGYKFEGNFFTAETAKLCSAGDKEEECTAWCDISSIKPRIIGLDFDGTVVTHRYPYVGEDIGAVPVLKELAEKGHKFILFTMRSHRSIVRDGKVIDTLQEAEDWFEKHGIELFGVNSNPQQSEWTDSPKAYCQVYIDDAAIGIPKKNDGERPYVDWKRMRDLLKEEGLL